MTTTAPLPGGSRVEDEDPEVTDHPHYRRRRRVRRVEGKYGPDNDPDYFQRLMQSGTSACY